MSLTFETIYLGVCSTFENMDTIEFIETIIQAIQTIEVWFDMFDTM